MAQCLPIVYAFPPDILQIIWDYLKYPVQCKCYVHGYFPVSFREYWQDKSLGISTTGTLKCIFFYSLLIESTFIRPTDIEELGCL